MQALIRREEDPCIQTGLHGRLHIFRLARYFLLCISILKPCMAMSCISTKERNTRRASSVGLNNLSPRKGHCSDQRRGTGTGGVIRYSEPCIGSELRALQAFGVTTHVLELQQLYQTNTKLPSPVAYFEHDSLFPTRAHACMMHAI